MRDRCLLIAGLAAIALAGLLLVLAERAYGQAEGPPPNPAVDRLFDPRCRLVLPDRWAPAPNTESPFENRDVTGVLETRRGTPRILPCEVEDRYPRNS